MGDPVIEVQGVTKAFGSTQALAGVNLTVERGTVMGLLGPNGAGKTTLVRILATLLKPDAGHARVAGFDVVKEARSLRSVIGLAGQYAAVDEKLTGRENLEMIGRLYHLSQADLKARATEVLKRFDLVFAENRLVKTYSGGMRRRLDLAASLVGRPAILILDEPTTGLDPRTRIELWHFIEDLVAEGTTLLMTTQYLEEAERLADRIAVVDGGRVIAEGTADELKARVGGAVLEVTVGDPSQLEGAARLLQGVGDSPPKVDVARLVVTLSASGAKAVTTAARLLDEGGIQIEDIGLRRPSLNDVFMSLTGHAAQEDRSDPEPAPGRRGLSRRHP